MDEPFLMPHSAYSVEKLGFFVGHHHRLNGTRPCFTRWLWSGLGLALFLPVF
jgi:hypothetical protein